MINKLPLIDKINFLESKLGERWTHPLLDPFKFDSSDTLSVQNAAKKIAQHLGLPPLTYIITYAKQKSNVGGHINLDSSKDVFIEIDDKFKSDCDIVLAVLSHEICHKYLHLNNLHDFRELENEMLTDAATVFTGLGKLSLNGCEKRNVFTGTSTTGKIKTTTTSTTTQRLGYMDRKQFAFIYRLVCEMRRIPQNLMLLNLTPEAAKEVDTISALESEYFNKKYFSNDYALSRISDAIQNEIGNSQKTFALFYRDIRIIQENILSSANQLYKDYHSFTKIKTDKINIEANKIYNKEAHNYIKNVFNLEELKTLKTNIIDRDNEVEKFGITLSEFIHFISISFPKVYSTQNLEFLYQFECPSCNNKMRIIERKLVRVKCPKCQYSFIIDTGSTENASLKQNTKSSNRKNQKRLWIKLKRLFLKSFRLLS